MAPRPAVGQGALCTTAKCAADGSFEALVKDFVSVGGTAVNCAGGLTPWGSWVTCEEATVGPRQGYGKKHGYAYEVSARLAAGGDGLQVPAIPIPEMGRFNHEAIAVDPATGIVYETEDSFGPNAGFYRFIPNVPGQLQQGGRLQMLAVDGQPRYSTVTGQTVGVSLPATWVDVEDPDPASIDDGNNVAVFDQGYAKGGARFIHLEGIWHGNGRLYFHSTSGGNVGRGQVWEYVPNGAGDGTLTLLFESPSVDVLDLPDNLVVTPKGSLLICEDGGGENYLRLLDQDGILSNFALNSVPGFTNQEFAGACFSPSGKTLFVNIQTPGITFAIWGPWENGAI